MASNQRTVRRWLATALLLGVSCAASSLAHAAPPQRIVSLNLCVDQILVDLVPPERIAAVTHLAADASVSAAPEKLARFSATRGAAEDVLARDPDLIIAGVYTTPATVDLLRRLGRRIVVVPLPDTIAGIRDLIGMIAGAVEEPAAGRSLIAAMDARLAATRPGTLRATAARPSALIYQVNNYVTGGGSLFDEALDRAGFRNAGRDVIRLASGRTSLEFIIATPPDVIVLASQPDAYASVVGDNLRHPALTQRLAQTPNIVLPWSLSLCGTHHIATAVETLAAARKAVLAAPKAGQ